MGTDLGASQREHWQNTYTRHPHMYGAGPSAPARHALEVFTARGARTVPELGAGHGRDALWLASQGMRVHGDDTFEHGGFAVHFFDRALVDDLAQGVGPGRGRTLRGGRAAPAVVALHPGQVGARLNPAPLQEAGCQGASGRVVHSARAPRSP